MRSDRSAMMMYASRPTELSDVTPKKAVSRDRTAGGAMVAWDYWKPYLPRSQGGTQGKTTNYPEINVEQGNHEVTEVTILRRIHCSANLI